MAKVICESCGSSFPLERVTNMESCPVCGEALWNNENEDTNSWAV